MEIDVFFVREKILAKQLSIVHIPALDQWADVLTKLLSSARFEVLVQTQCEEFLLKTLPLEFEGGSM